MDVGHLPAYVVLIFMHVTRLCESNAQSMHTHTHVHTCDIRMSHVCTCVCVCMDCAFDSHRRVTCIKIRTTYAGKCPTSIKHRVVRADIETNCGRAGFVSWRVQVGICVCVHGLCV